MPYRCANPLCQFDYYAMRAICPDPVCLKRPQPGCGRYFRFLADGTVEKLAPGVLPPADAEGVVWLCCYCSMEYEVAGPGRLRIAPDPLSFVWRWQVERSEAAIAHELG